MQQIPIRATNNQAMSVTLENRVYDIEFIWNARVGAMSLNLFFQGEPLLLGIKMTIDWPLIGAYKKQLGPPGEMFLVNLEDQQRPSLSDFGDKVILIYLTEQEVSGIGG